MFEEHGFFLWYALIILLLGMVIGRIWGVFVSQEKRKKKRRERKGITNYLLGLNYLISGNIDPALFELSQAAKLNPEAVEIYITLGDLFREKGQVERAIDIHQALLHRSSLLEMERSQALLSLGLDFRKAGIIDRAIEIFERLIAREPTNIAALIQLEKLYEDIENWEKAYSIEEKILSLTDSSDYTVLAFLENEMGRKKMDEGEVKEATKHFERAISLEKITYPAYLNLGELYYREGEIEKAVNIWEKIISLSPKRAYLAFENLAKGYEKLGNKKKFEEILGDLVKKDPKDWRSRLALSEILREGNKFEDAFSLLLEAFRTKPHSLSLHQAFLRLLFTWHGEEGYIAQFLKISEERAFFIDPYVCIRCRYKTTELLWKCPHCHEWNTFIEEKF
jgi:lipopolysaccharide biosynthesis regulator YciM